MEAINELGFKHEKKRMMFPACKKFKQKHETWFIKDSPLQAGVIQLWATRFTEFLLGTIRKFYVLCFENCEKHI